jgi:hypothetical protein
VVTSLPGPESTPCEVLVLGVRLDGRPLTGLTGRIDWRCGGRLSDLVRSGVIPTEGPLLLPAPPVLAAGRLVLWATADITLDKLLICLKNLRVARPGLCPADLGLDATAVRAALGPQAALFAPSGEPVEAGQGG